jgi:hypothetical protein
MTRIQPLTSLFFGLAMLLAMPMQSAMAAAGTSRPIPLVSTGSWCLPQNSSCQDGPWWQAQSERTTVRLRQATATYVGLDGLTSDPDFGEAVRLLWQWPEGRRELIGAADLGVTIVQGPHRRNATTDSFATYQESTLTVEVAYEDMDVPTWMLADLLAHELRHANDLGQPGDAFAGRKGCFALEERAYATEQRYMTWLANRFGPLPSDAAETDAELSYAADDLYANMMHLNDTEDVAVLVHSDYADTC